MVVSCCGPKSLPVHPFNALRNAISNFVRCIIKTFQKTVTLYLACNDKNTFFTSTGHREGINYGLVRKCVTLYRISWIIFIFDLVLKYTNSWLVFRLVQIVLLL